MGQTNNNNKHKRCNTCDRCDILSHTPSVGWFVDPRTKEDVCRECWGIIFEAIEEFGYEEKKEDKYPTPRDPLDPCVRPPTAQETHINQALWEEILEQTD